MTSTWLFIVLLLIYVYVRAIAYRSVSRAHAPERISTVGLRCGILDLSPTYLPLAVNCAVTGPRAHPYSGTSHRDRYRQSASRTRARCRSVIPAGVTSRRKATRAFPARGTQVNRIPWSAGRAGRARPE